MSIDKKKSDDRLAVIGIATHVRVKTHLKVRSVVLRLILSLDLLHLHRASESEFFKPLVVITAVVAFANLKQADLGILYNGIQMVKLLDMAAASGTNDFLFHSEYLFLSLMV
jgi:hypothetical protein